MDFILGGVTRTINAMSAVLGGFSFTRNLAADVAKVGGYLQTANRILPVSEALTVLSLWLAVTLALITYYWITRALNLLRGAG